MAAIPGKDAAAVRSARARRLRKSLLAEMMPRLLQEDGLTREEALVREMMETSCRLLRDRASLGDVKLLNAALRELRYALSVFAPYRQVRKVSVFGSARTPQDAPAAQTAHEFAHQIAEAGFMIITGAGPGIMEAAQKGAGRERSFGVNIRLPFEQSANEFIRNDPKLVTFRYFFTRKLLFVKEADAVCLFPGGFGTLDEGYECITLVQTGKSKPMPIVCLDRPGGTYWKTWRRTIEDHLLRRGLISEQDMSLFSLPSSIEEAVAEIAGFYRVYHSSRVVEDDFVIRLVHRLDPDVVRALAGDFADIIVGGGIEQRDALPLEREQEPELNDLPRLVFRFDRAGYGRLRQLIDRLNRDG